MIVRLDDTDMERNTEASVQSIFQRYFPLDRFTVVTLVPDLIYVLLSCRRGHSPSIRDLFWRELVEVRVAMRERGQ